MLMGKNGIYKKIFGYVLSLSILAAAGTIIYFSSPVKELAEISSDEGINLMKSFLYLKGYRLYSEIWSDQPPLFTFLLAGWIKITGCSLHYCRLLIVFFSALTVWSLFEIVKKKTENIPAAFIAVFLLLTSIVFLRLSIVILIGLPAIVFLMLAVLCINYYKDKKNKIFLILSAILFAISMHIKLFTTFVVIAVLPEIILSVFEQTDDRKELVKKSLFASLSFLLPLILVYSLVSFLFRIDFSQLLEPHIKAESLQNISDLKLIDLFLQDFYLLIPAVISGVLAVLMKRRTIIFPLTWFLTGTLIYLNHNPFWIHHYLIVLIPMCWLAGLGIAELFNKATWKKIFKDTTIMLMPKIVFSTLIFILLAGSLTAVCFVPINFSKLKTIRAAELSASIPSGKISSLIGGYRDLSRFSIVDKPIYLFNNQMLMPPELVVFSVKRISTDFLTGDYLTALIAKYKPGIINFSRIISLNKRILPHIKNDYILLVFDMANPDAPPHLYQDSFNDLNLLNRNALFLFVDKAIYQARLKAISAGEESHDL